MKKVITYGTFDLLHYGHINLLKKAKELGDYLIVGITSDDFDKQRGKINVNQTLVERIEAVKGLSIADEIIIEEYEGQKIDDILKYGIDVFTVGSDWVGKFDYLNDYCKVIYLPRTEGVSSSNIRSENNIRIGIVGNLNVINKFIDEAQYVNGVSISSLFTTNSLLAKKYNSTDVLVCKTFEEAVNNCDAIYIVSSQNDHYKQVKYCLEHNKHVLCTSPVALNKKEYLELCEYADKNELILCDALKTAYLTAFIRLCLLAKSGAVGEIVSIDSVCTSMSDKDSAFDYEWGSLCAWGPTALLPIVNILGDDVMETKIFTKRNENGLDIFTSVILQYKNAIGTIKVGKGVKSEGYLIISGTKGYIYVPAPWWKTEYFEIRYEDESENKKFYYQFLGEGIRYEIIAFANCIRKGIAPIFLSKNHMISIINVIEQYYCGKITEL